MKYELATLLPPGFKELEEFIESFDDERIVYYFPVGQCDLEFDPDVLWQWFQRYIVDMHYIDGYREHPMLPCDKVLVGRRMTLYFKTKNKKLIL